MTNLQTLTGSVTSIPEKKGLRITATEDSTFLLNNEKYSLSKGQWIWYWSKSLAS